MPRPIQELKGVPSRSAGAGETRRIEFEMPVDQLGFYDEGMRLVVEPGTIEVMVASSSQDVRQKGTFETAGDESRIVPRRVFRGVTRVPGQEILPGMIGRRPCVLSMNSLLLDQSRRFYPNCLTKARGHGGPGDSRPCGIGWQACLSGIGLPVDERHDSDDRLTRSRLGTHRTISADSFEHLWQAFASSLKPPAAALLCDRATFEGLGSMRTTN